MNNRIILLSILTFIFLGCSEPCDCTEEEIDSFLVRYEASANTNVADRFRYTNATGNEDSYDSLALPWSLEQNMNFETDHPYISMTLFSGGVGTLSIFVNDELVETSTQTLQEYQGMSISYLP